MEADFERDFLETTEAIVSKPLASAQVRSTSCKLLCKLLSTLQTTRLKLLTHECKHMRFTRK